MLMISSDRLPTSRCVGRIRYEAGWQNLRGSPKMPMLFYVYSGCMRFCVNGRDVPLTAGTALLLTVEDVYTVRAQEDSDYAYFHFRAEAPAAVDPHVPQPNGAARRPDALTLPSATPIHPPREQTEHLCGMILRYESAGPPLDLMRLDISLLRLLVLLSEGNATPAADARGGQAKATYLAIREHLEAHYARPVSLSSVSAHMGVSPQYAARVFRRFANTGITAYLQALRLKKSEELLRYTPLSVSQIAFAVGFSSPYYYCRLFGRAYGVPPTEFRRAVLEEG